MGNWVETTDERSSVGAEDTAVACGTGGARGSANALSMSCPKVSVEAKATRSVRSSQSSSTSSCSLTTIDLITSNA